ncbi:MAG: 2-C-methyl-D-erythritol 4-phosphate cytidylyltransferase [Paramuribaculum sp.]|nr:2-C-methyl-D-erythritol 4-phosphate cytidylyltransferase [Paramuribaculum sp.]
MEAAGYDVSLVEGSPANIKVTNPSDIAIAEILLRQCND